MDFQYQNSQPFQGVITEMAMLTDIYIVLAARTQCLTITRSLCRQ